MWCFKEFTFPFFFTSVWTLLGTKVEAFAPLPSINLLLHQLLTGHNPQIPQMLRVGGPAGIWASRSDNQPVESWDWGQRQRESYLKKQKKQPDLSPLQLTYAWYKHARRQRHWHSVAFRCLQVRTEVAVCAFQGKPALLCKWSRQWEVSH